MCQPIWLLGLNVVPIPLDVQGKLPLLYGNDYAFFSAAFANQRCIILRYHGGYLSIPRMQKHMREIPKLLHMDAPCVLWLDKATAAQQARLLENQIPFFIDEKTVYLPFLGLRFDRRKEPIETFREHFTAASQCVFLYLLYQDTCACRVGEIKEKLQLSLMTVSRALQELSQKKLLEVSGRNTRKQYRRIDRRRFWNEGRAYLIDPVQKKYYIDNDQIFQTIKSYAAGETALANYSMLSAPAYPCRAVDKGYAEAVKKVAAESPDDLFTETYSMIEIWRYDPGLFADSKNNVDVFSLYASLGGLLEDERVAKEMENLMERYFDGSGN